MSYSIPDEPATELRNMSKYLKGNPDSASHSHLLLEYAKEEVERKERLVEIDEAGGWIAVVPFWATWPFEIMGTLISLCCLLSLFSSNGIPLGDSAPHFDRIDNDWFVY